MYVTQDKVSKCLCSHFCLPFRFLKTGKPASEPTCMGDGEGRWIYYGSFAGEQVRLLTLRPLSFQALGEKEAVVYTSLV